jgi:hypothetical protein
LRRYQARDTSRPFHFGGQPTRYREVVLTESSKTLRGGWQLSELVTDSKGS